MATDFSSLEAKQGQTR